MMYLSPWENKNKPNPKTVDEKRIRNKAGRWDGTARKAACQRDARADPCNLSSDTRVILKKKSTAEVNEKECRKQCNRWNKNWLRNTTKFVLWNYIKIRGKKQWKEKITDHSLWWSETIFSKSLKTKFKNTSEWSS